MKKKQIENVAFSKKYEPYSIIEKTKNADYSDIVRWLKILLPVVAALLCGLLIIMPKLKDETAKFSLSIATPKFGNAEKLRMLNPNFVGNDSKNNVFNVRALEAIEIKAGSNIMELIEPKSNIPMDEKNWYSVDAKKGFFDQNNNIVDLINEVTIFSNEGTSLETESAKFDFAKEYAKGDNKVHVQGDFGVIDSNRFEFFMDKNIFIFRDKARMIIFEEGLNKDK